MAEGSKSSIHECKVCQQTFSRSCKLALHMKTHSYEDNQLYGDIFTSSPKEQVVVVASPPPPCPLPPCSPPCPPLSPVSTINTYSCKICSRVYHRRAPLIRHSYIAHRIIESEISDADEDLSVRTGRRGRPRKKTIQLPNQNPHHQGLKYECPICHQKMTQSSTLSSHLRKHTGERPFKCNNCQKTFGFYQCLWNHRQKHNGERKFRCDVCHKSFIYYQNLWTHYRVHTGGKQYECLVCGQRYLQSNTLQQHIKKHIQDNKVPGKRGKRKIFNEQVKPYRYVHALEMPFECEVCKKKFRLQRSLKMHKKCHRSANIMSSEDSENYLDEKPTNSTSNSSKGQDEDMDPLAMNVDVVNSVDNHEATVCEGKDHSTGKQSLRKNRQKMSPCHVCKKEFKNYLCLKLHMEKHLETPQIRITKIEPINQKDRKPFTFFKEVSAYHKPHKCKYCDKSYFHSASLYKHIKTHQKRNMKFSKKTISLPSSSLHDNEVDTFAKNEFLNTSDLCSSQSFLTNLDKLNEEPCTSEILHINLDELDNEQYMSPDTELLNALDEKPSTSHEPDINSAILYEEPHATHKIEINLDRTDKDTCTSQEQHISLKKLEKIPCMSQTLQINLDKLDEEPSTSQNFHSILKKSGKQPCTLRKVKVSLRKLKGSGSKETLKICCDICGKRFTKIGYLKQHLKSVKHVRPSSMHNSAVDHQCEICHKRFQHRGSLLRHRRMIHSQLRGTDNQKITSRLKTKKKVKFLEVTDGPPDLQHQNVPVIKQETNSDTTPVSMTGKKTFVKQKYIYKQSRRQEGYQLAETQRNGCKQSESHTEYKLEVVDRYKQVPVAHTKGVNQVKGMAKPLESGTVKTIFQNKKKAEKIKKDKKLSLAKKKAVKASRAMKQEPCQYCGTLFLRKEDSAFHQVVRACQQCGQKFSCSNMFCTHASTCSIQYKESVVLGKNYCEVGNNQGHVSNICGNKQLEVADNGLNTFSECPVQETIEVPPIYGGCCVSYDESKIEVDPLEINEDSFGNLAEERNLVFQFSKDLLPDAKDNGKLMTPSTSFADVDDIRNIPVNVISEDVKKGNDHMNNDYANRSVSSLRKPDPAVFEQYVDLTSNFSNNFQCVLCSKVFPTVSALTHHAMDHIQ